jgi:hypothetical protein
MSNKHNKKRNVGIIYELFVRHIANCIIENDKKSAKVATTIMEKRFAKGTELYKEFRLFNALATSNISSTPAAAAILTEAKNAARRSNVVKLDREKSALIKDINYKINNSDFYYRNVSNYSEYANIQNLLNEWRKEDDANLKKIVEFEKRAIDWLITEKVNKDLNVIKEETDYSQSDKLVFNIMTKKLNEKYSHMSSDQKDIIKNYAFYGENNKEKLVEYLENKKIQTLRSLKKFENINKNKIVSGKINEVSSKIQNLDTSNISDSSIVKFLTLTSLVNEINSED